jgi:hypothetical protein
MKSKSWKWTTFQIENEVHNASASFLHSHKQLSQIAEAAIHLPDLLGTIMTPQLLQDVDIFY